MIVTRWQHWLFYVVKGIQINSPFIFMRLLLCFPASVQQILFFIPGVIVLKLTELELVEETETALKTRLSKS